MSCTKCRLSLHRKTVQQGVGQKINPEVCIITSYPGLEEDLTGKSFASGYNKIVHSLLRDAGIPSYKCYLTHMVKCKPPDRREPEYEEYMTCWSEVLSKELEVLKPKKVILLGQIPSHILAQKKATIWRGFAWEDPDCKTQYMVTLDGKDVMKQAEMYPVVVEDIRRFLSFEPQEDNPTYHINPPWEAIQDLMDKWMDSYVAVDIETAGDKENPKSLKGLNPFVDDIIGIAFCGEPGVAVHYSRQDLLRYFFHIKDYLSKHPKIVFQNNLFDRTFLKVKGVDTQILGWDTRNGIHWINSRLPQDLDFLRSVYTPLPPYKAVYREKGIHLLNPYDLGWYNCRDVDITHRVCVAQQPFVPSNVMSKIMQTEEVALHMKYKGLKIDLDALAGHYARIKPTMDTLAQEFQDKYRVSISSPKQLSNFLYKDLGLNPPAKAKTKQTWSTDKEVIEAIASKCFEGTKERIILDHIIEFRKAQTIATRYCEGTYKLIQKDGHVHPNWKTTGTDTGRWACDSPSIQNFPSYFKDVIIPEEGYTFIGADYDRIEIWIAALVSQDERMLDLLKNNVDIHNIVMEEIKKSYPSITRLQTKTVVFGTFYGSTAQNFAERYRVSVAVAKSWQDIFFNTFEGIKNLFTKTIPNEWASKGYVTTLYGRRKYTSKLTEALNFPIQSTAFEVMANGLIALHKEGYDTRLSIHDSAVAQIPLDSDIEAHKARYKELLETASPELYSRFPCEVKVGKSWLEV